MWVFPGPILRPEEANVLLLVRLRSSIPRTCLALPTKVHLETLDLVLHYYCVDCKLADQARTGDTSYGSVGVALLQSRSPLETSILANFRSYPR